MAERAVPPTEIGDERFPPPPTGKAEHGISVGADWIRAARTPGETWTGRTQMPIGGAAQRPGYHDLGRFHRQRITSRPQRPALEQVRVGCSGWNYQDWRGAVYPPGLPASRWLEHYSTVFDTVEVNTTFYRLIGRAAVERWVEQTPAHFVFAVKASRYLTHVKRLRDIADGVSMFYERLQPIVDSGRLGPVLWQLPENFHRDDERLASALAELPAGSHAFEFRHPSWFVPEVYALLRAHDASLVIGDHPARRFQSDEATAGWRYLRLHHGSRGRRGNYSRRELQDWAKRIHRWRAEGPIYIYFNNDWEAFAPRNARELLRQVQLLAAEPVHRAEETAKPV